jgi:hypothetical protein
MKLLTGLEIGRIEAALDPISHASNLVFSNLNERLIPLINQCLPASIE